jgi:5-methylcytosine-specific restriction endonuclease McrA
MSNINKKVKIARLKKTIKITSNIIKISLENLIDDVNKKTSSIQKEIHDVFEKLNKLPGNKYQYKEKFVIDEENPNFTNEIDELDYIHESLIFKYAQLEIKLNTLKNDYEKILKNHIAILNEKNETLQKENNNLIHYLQKARWEYKLQEIHIDPPDYNDIETMYFNKVLKYKSLKNAIKYYLEKNIDNIEHKCLKLSINIKHLQKPIEDNIENLKQYYHLLKDIFIIKPGPDIPVVPLNDCYKCKFIRKICNCLIRTRLRCEVWDKWIGTEFRLYKCICCSTKLITPGDFACGHVKSRNNGGSININNLRPICTSCNSSMGTQHMDEYRQIKGYDKV